MNLPQFYQTEPQLIEAIQFLGGEESAEKVLAWAGVLGFKGGWYPAFDGELEINGKPKKVSLAEQIRIQGKTHLATLPVGYYLYIVSGTNQLRTMAPEQFEGKFKGI